MSFRCLPSSWACSVCRCGAVDGCHTPLLTPFGEHKEDFTDRYARCSLLFLAISDTRLIRYFVGGFPGSRGDSTAFKARSWYRAMLDPDGTRPPLEDGEFILGDAGFALTVFLVCHAPPGEHHIGMALTLDACEERVLVGLYGGGVGEGQAASAALARETVGHALPALPLSHCLDAACPAAQVPPRRRAFYIPQSGGNAYHADHTFSGRFPSVTVSDALFLVADHSFPRSRHARTQRRVHEAVQPSTRKNARCDRKCFWAAEG